MDDGGRNRAANDREPGDLTVLVVDDEPDVAFYLGSVLVFEDNDLLKDIEANNPDEFSPSCGGIRSGRASRW